MASVSMQSFSRDTLPNGGNKFWGTQYADKLGLPPRRKLSRYRSFLWFCLAHAHLVCPRRIPYQRQMSKILTCCKAPRSRKWYQTPRILPTCSWWVTKLPIPFRRFHPPSRVWTRLRFPMCSPSRKATCCHVCLQPQAPSLADA